MAAGPCWPSRPCRAPASQPARPALSWRACFACAPVCCLLLPCLLEPRLCPSSWLPWVRRRLVLVSFGGAAAPSFRCQLPPVRLTQQASRASRLGRSVAQPRQWYRQPLARSCSHGQQGPPARYSRPKIVQPPCPRAPSPALHGRNLPPASAAVAHPGSPSVLTTVWRWSTAPYSIV